MFRCLAQNLAWVISARAVEFDDVQCHGVRAKAHRDRPSPRP
jgi:hypothetical protein